ncbi:MAG: hypothetical protein ACLSA6_05685 [Holdemania massiliensis]
MKKLYTAVLSHCQRLAGGWRQSMKSPRPRSMPMLAEVMGSLEKFPGTTYAEVTEYTDESGLVTGVYRAEGRGYMFQVELLVSRIRLNLFWASIMIPR